MKARLITDKQFTQLRERIQKHAEKLCKRWADVISTEYGEGPMIGQRHFVIRVEACVSFVDLHKRGLLKVVNGTVVERRKRNPSLNPGVEGRTAKGPNT